MENINFEELTPELQAYIDQERTKASKSAYAKRRKEVTQKTRISLTTFATRLKKKRV